MKLPKLAYTREGSAHPPDDVRLYRYTERFSGWLVDCGWEHIGDLPADAVPMAPDTGLEDGAAASEALYVALRRFAYAWETDTPDREMWAEWQRAKDAMTAYRSATAVPDTEPWPGCPCGCTDAEEPA